MKKLLFTAMLFITIGLINRTSAQVFDNLGSIIDGAVLGNLTPALPEPKVAASSANAALNTTVEVPDLGAGATTTTNPTTGAVTKTSADGNTSITVLGNTTTVQVYNPTDGTTTTTVTTINKDAATKTVSNKVVDKNGQVIKESSSSSKLE